MNTNSRYSAVDHRPRVAIVGLGNCASSLLQLIYAPESEGPLGVAYENIGRLSRGDVNIVAAFDVNHNKVGKDISEAIAAAPNNTSTYFSVPQLGVTVLPGKVCDGISADLAEHVPLIGPECQADQSEMVRQLRGARAEIVVLYLPVGSAEATTFYVEAALAAGCAVVNCTPQPVATDPEWQRRFAEARLPLLGDDVKSQIGATTLHRALLHRLASRGATVERSYQLNVGGNMDFLNMTDRRRSMTKRASKSSALVTLENVDRNNLNVGPSDYLPILSDRKVAYLRLEGTACLGMRFSLEARLEVEDSPNSAGVVIDAIRCTKIALNRKLGGGVAEPSGLLFKIPPVRFTDAEQSIQFESFIQ